MITYNDGALIRFEVIGVPAPQGSTRAFVVGNRAVTTNKGNKAQMAWRDSVARAAHDIANHDDIAAPLDGPLVLSVEFRFPMPKSRPKRDRLTGNIAKTTAPDVDKLLRSVCDALQAAGLVADDARIAAIAATKREVVGWTGAVITIGATV